VIQVESAFNPNAVSRKGAVGLMQLMPETAARYQVQDRKDPQQNIRAGMSYLLWLLQKFGGRVDLALAAYNASETVVEKFQGIPPDPAYDETRAYVPRVMALYKGADIIDVNLQPAGESGQVAYVDELQTYSASGALKGSMTDAEITTLDPETGSSRTVSRKTGKVSRSSVRGSEERTKVDTHYDEAGQVRYRETSVFNTFGRPETVDTGEGPYLEHADVFYSGGLETGRLISVNGTTIRVFRNYRYYGHEMRRDVSDILSGEQYVEYVKDGVLQWRQYVDPVWHPIQTVYYDPVLGESRPLYAKNVDGQIVEYYAVAQYPDRSVTVVYGPDRTRIIRIDERDPRGAPLMKWDAASQMAQLYHYDPVNRNGKTLNLDGRHEAVTLEERRRITAAEMGIPESAKTTPESLIPLPKPKAAGQEQSPDIDIEPLSVPASLTPLKDLTKRYLVQPEDQQPQSAPTAPAAGTHSPALSPSQGTGIDQSLRWIAGMQYGTSIRSYEVPPQQDADLTKIRPDIQGYASRLESTYDLAQSVMLDVMMGDKASAQAKLQRWSYGKAPQSNLESTARTGELVWLQGLAAAQYASRFGLDDVSERTMRIAMDHIKEVQNASGGVRMAAGDRAVSTEHNLDALAFLTLAKQVGFKDPRLEPARARLAQWILTEGYNASEQRMNRGQNDHDVVTDVQAWGVMALTSVRDQDPQFYRQSGLDRINLPALLSFAERQTRATVDYKRPDDRVVRVTGYKYWNGPGSPVSVEWTLQMAMAYRAIGNVSKANEILAQIDQVRNADGSLPYALSAGWTYPGGWVATTFPATTATFHWIFASTGFNYFAPKGGALFQGAALPATMPAAPAQPLDQGTAGAVTPAELSRVATLGTSLAQVVYDPNYGESMPLFSVDQKGDISEVYIPVAHADNSRTVSIYRLLPGTKYRPSGLDSNNLLAQYQSALAEGIRLNPVFETRDYDPLGRLVEVRLGNWRTVHTYIGDTRNLLHSELTFKGDKVWDVYYPGFQTLDDSVGGVNSKDFEQVLRDNGLNDKERRELMDRLDDAGLANGRANHGHRTIPKLLKDKLAGIKLYGDTTLQAAVVIFANGGISADYRLPGDPMEQLVLSNHGLTATINTKFDGRFPSESFTLEPRGLVTARYATGEAVRADQLITNLPANQRAEYWRNFARLQIRPESLLPKVIEKHFLMDDSSGELRYVEEGALTNEMYLIPNHPLGVDLLRKAYNGDLVVNEWWLPELTDAEFAKINAGRDKDDQLSRAPYGILPGSIVYSKEQKQGETKRFIPGDHRPYHEIFIGGKVYQAYLYNVTHSQLKRSVDYSRVTGQMLQSGYAFQIAREGNVVPLIDDRPDHWEEIVYDPTVPYDKPLFSYRLLDGKVVLVKRFLKIERRAENGHQIETQTVEEPDGLAPNTAPRQVLYTYVDGVLVDYTPITPWKNYWRELKSFSIAVGVLLAFLKFMVGKYGSRDSRRLRRAFDEELGRRRMPKPSGGPGGSVSPPVPLANVPVAELVDIDPDLDFLRANGVPESRLDELREEVENVYVHRQLPLRLYSLIDETYRPLIQDRLVRFGVDMHEMSALENRMVQRIQEQFGRKTINISSIREKSTANFEGWSQRFGGHHKADAFAGDPLLGWVLMELVSDYTYEMKAESPSVRYYLQDKAITMMEQDLRSDPQTDFFRAFQEIRNDVDAIRFLLFPSNTMLEDTPEQRAAKWAIVVPLLAVAYRDMPENTPDERAAKERKKNEVEGWALRQAKYRAAASPPKNTVVTFADIRDLFMNLDENKGRNDNFIRQYNQLNGQSYEQKVAFLLGRNMALKTYDDELGLKRLIRNVGGTIVGLMVKPFVWAWQTGAEIRRSRGDATLVRQLRNFRSLMVVHGLLWLVLNSYVFKWALVVSHSLLPAGLFATFALLGTIGVAGLMIILSTWATMYFVMVLFGHYQGKRDGIGQVKDWGDLQKNYDYARLRFEQLILADGAKEKWADRGEPWNLIWKAYLDEFLREKYLTKDEYNALLLDPKTAPAPKSEYAREHLQRFVGSFLMDIPPTDFFSAMPSLTLAAMAYGEKPKMKIAELDGVEGKGDLAGSKETPLTRLARVYADEWNLLIDDMVARHGRPFEAIRHIRDMEKVRGDANEPGILPNITDEQQKEIEDWANMRLWFVYKTIHDLDKLRDAFRLLAVFSYPELRSYLDYSRRMEKNDLNRLVDHKLQVMIRYHSYDGAKAPVKNTINEMMREYPYVEWWWVEGPDNRHASLHKGAPDRIVSVAPNVPYIRDNKQFGQNQTFPHVRGEKLLVFDANAAAQTGDGIKLGSALAEFKRNPKMAAVLFGEYIFNKMYSKAAEALASTEETFTQVVQRILAMFRACGEYGHSFISDVETTQEVGGYQNDFVSEDLVKAIMQWMGLDFVKDDSPFASFYTEHKEYLLLGKGREAGFHGALVPLFKWASGSAEMGVSRLIPRVRKSRRVTLAQKVMLIFALSFFWRKILVPMLNILYLVYVVLVGISPYHASESFLIAGMVGLLLNQAITLELLLYIHERTKYYLVTVKKYARLTLINIRIFPPVIQVYALGVLVGAYGAAAFNISAKGLSQARVLLFDNVLRDNKDKPVAVVRRQSIRLMLPMVAAFLIVTTVVGLGFHNIIPMTPLLFRTMLGAYSTLTVGFSLLWVFSYLGEAGGRRKSLYNWLERKIGGVTALRLQFILALYMLAVSFWGIYAWRTALSVWSGFFLLVPVVMLMTPIFMHEGERQILGRRLRLPRILRWRTAIILGALALLSTIAKAAVVVPPAALAAAAVGWPFSWVLAACAVILVAGVLAAGQIVRRRSGILGTIYGVLLGSAIAAVTYFQLPPSDILHYMDVPSNAFYDQWPILFPIVSGSSILGGFLGAFARRHLPMKKTPGGFPYGGDADFELPSATLGWSILGLILTGLLSVITGGVIDHPIGSAIVTGLVVSLALYFSVRYWWFPRSKSRKGRYEIALKAMWGEFHIENIDDSSSQEGYIADLFFKSIPDADNSRTVAEKFGSMLARRRFDLDDSLRGKIMEILRSVPIKEESIEGSNEAMIQDNLVSFSYTKTERYPDPVLLQQRFNELLDSLEIERATARAASKQAKRNSLMILAPAVSIPAGLSAGTIALVLGIAIPILVVLSLLIANAVSGWRAKRLARAGAKRGPDALAGSLKDPAFIPDIGPDQIPQYRDQIFTILDDGHLAANREVLANMLKGAQASVLTFELARSRRYAARLQAGDSWTTWFRISTWLMARATQILSLPIDWLNPDRELNPDRINLRSLRSMEGGA
jgi:hypothetical protein